MKISATGSGEATFGGFLGPFSSCPLKNFGLDLGTHLKAAHLSPAPWLAQSQLVTSLAMAPLHTRLPVLASAFLNHT